MYLKTYALIARKEGMDREEFHDHYRHPHATLAGDMIRTLRGYTQNHQIDTDWLGETQRHYDAVAEMMVDNIEDVRNFRTEPVMVENIIDDEPRFMNMDKLAFVTVEQEILLSGPQESHQDKGDRLWRVTRPPLAIKLMQFVLPGGNPDWAGKDDAELAGRLGVFRHTRGRPSAEMHGDNPPFLGLRELWWPTRTAFNRAVAADRPAFDAIVAKGGAAETFLVQAEMFF